MFSPDRSAVSPHRGWWVVAAALLGLHVVLAWLGRDAGVATGEDPAKYISLGRELVGFSYRDVDMVGEPLHYRYPPGYPAVLAVASLASSSLDWLLFVTIACSAAALGFFCLAVARAWNARFAILLLAALAVNPVIVGLAGAVSAETPFMLWLAIALWGTTRETPGAPWYTGAAGILAALTRSAGVVVVPALVAYWIWRRQWRAALVFSLAAILTVGAWQVHSVSAPSQYVGDSYAADFVRGGERATDRVGASGLITNIVGRVWTNSQWYLVRGLPPRIPLPSIPGTPIDNAAHLLILVAGLGVGVVVIARRWPAALALIVFYGGLLAVWPWQVSRFLAPVVPLLVLAVLTAASTVAGRFWAGSGPRVAAALGAVIIVTGGVRTAELLGRAAACDRSGGPTAAGCLTTEQDAYLRVVAFIGDSTARDAIVLAAKPASVHHFSGHQSVPHRAVTQLSASEYLPFLRSRAVRYVLLGTVHATELNAYRRLIESNCSALTLRTAIAPYAFLFALGDPPPDDGVVACKAVALHMRATEGYSFEVPR